MSRASSTGVVRQLQLLLGVLAVALGLLAMHQLSGIHTAVDRHGSTGPTVGLASAASASEEHGLFAAAGSAHGHVVAATGEGHPDSEESGCPDCADDHAMALTCLATLIVLTVCRVLAGPSERRGGWLRRTVLTLPPATGFRLPVSPSLVELSVSRT